MKAMAIEYGTFQCSICGREGFAPLPADDDPLSDSHIELTCSRAHTDLYSKTMIRRVASNPPGKLLVREAFAGAAAGAL